MTIHDPSTITSFAEKYIVPESVVKIALDDQIFKQLTKEAKKQERRKVIEMEKKLSFDDINWLGKVEDGSIKSLLVKTLNKYFLNYNMAGCLTLKKAAKIEVISRHVRSQSLNASDHNILGHEDGEMVDENDS